MLTAATAEPSTTSVPSHNCCWTSSPPTGLLHSVYCNNTILHRPLKVPCCFVTNLWTRELWNDRLHCPSQLVQHWNSESVLLVLWRQRCVQAGHWTVHTQLIILRVILAYMCVKLQMRLYVCHRVGPFWVHFGSILGPFWVHFGSILGSILGPFWVHFGSISGPFRVHGSISGPFRVHFAHCLSGDAS